MQDSEAISIAVWAPGGQATAIYNVIKKAAGFALTVVPSLSEIEHALASAPPAMRAAILEVHSAEDAAAATTFSRETKATGTAVVILDYTGTANFPISAEVIKAPASSAGIVMALQRAFGKVNHPKGGVEMWGGVECTVNRVGDQFFDQSERNGHCSRTDDIDRLAKLGIRKLRYPVLWETHLAKPEAWKATETQLHLIRRRGIDPIVGLVHHGSGPKHTNLLEPSFVDGLAEHAANVARRFPWLRCFTPVNEPLTTARFSCLYGHWYPHHKDSLSFIRALLIELKATRAAMKAIRTIIPDAQLVQTEDIGRTYSTAEIAYQAEFDNHRRWLTFDLLCGRVNRDHPLWEFLQRLGISEEEILTFAEDPCPPDILGVNYYVTSERFLDHRLENYPPRAHGGNGRDHYADVCAVRVSSSGTGGHYGILKEVWNRYNHSFALTEVHLGCTREEQLRWMMEAWGAANALAAEGVDIRAITAWSLLGAYDWDSLLVKSVGYYEPGAFDARQVQQPRATALAHCIQSLAETGDFDHPVLASPGWWRRDIRYTYKPARPAQAIEHSLPFVPRSATMAKPILVTGARGTLGRAFERLCAVRGLRCVALNRHDLDITNSESIQRAVRQVRPWAIINCAGYVRVDEAEKDVERCLLENAAGPALWRPLAANWESTSSPFLQTWFSTGLI